LCFTCAIPWLHELQPCAHQKSKCISTAIWPNSPSFTGRKTKKYANASKCCKMFQAIMQFEYVCS
jgi:hypothetical protein